MKGFDFNFGDCDIYAISLHRIYDYPIYAVMGIYASDDYGKKGYKPSNDDEYEEEYAHLVVKLPNGNFMDADGEFTEKQIIKLCVLGKTKDVQLVRMDEKKAKWLFRCGESDEDSYKKENGVSEKEIEKVKNYILEKTKGKMKHLKKFNENVKEFDLEFAISKIKDKYSDDDVISRFDEEILEWVDSDWENEYDSEYDWYIDHNNGEAQDVVITELISWYKKEFGKISSDNSSDLFDKIKEEYDCLNYQ